MKREIDARKIFKGLVVLVMVLLAVSVGKTVYDTEITQNNRIATLETKTVPTLLPTATPVLLSPTASPTATFTPVRRVVTPVPTQ